MTKKQDHFTGSPTGNTKHEELFHGRREDFLWIEYQTIETCLKSRVRYIPPAVNESREEMKNR